MRTRFPSIHPISEVWEISNPIFNYNFPNCVDRISRHGPSTNLIWGAHLGKQETQTREYFVELQQHVLSTPYLHRLKNYPSWYTKQQITSFLTSCVYFKNGRTQLRTNTYIHKLYLKQFITNQDDEYSSQLPNKLQTVLSRTIIPIMILIEYSLNLPHDADQTTDRIMRTKPAISARKLPNETNHHLAPITSGEHLLQLKYYLLNCK